MKMLFVDFLKLIDYLSRDFNKNNLAFLDNPEKVLKELEISYEKSEISNFVEFIKVNGIYLIGKTHKMKVTEDLMSSLSFYNLKLKEVFDNTILMYKSLFELGVALILIAVLVAVFTDKNVFALISGFSGGASIIYQLLYKPIDRLQRTIAKYTQLQIIYFNWFQDYDKYDHYVIGASTKDGNNQREMIGIYSSVAPFLYNGVKQTVEMMKNTIEKEK